MFELLTQSSDPNQLPFGTAIGMIVLFGGAAIVSLVGLFAPSSKLESMAGVIGTKNPLVARIVCAIGLLIGSFAVVAAVLSLVGKPL
jgi:hypothetical protein